MDADQVRAEIEAKYGQSYSATIGNVEYIFRPLLVKEINQIKYSDTNLVELEDQIVKTCVEYPKNVNFERVKAGYVTQLSDEILRASGFNDLGALNALLESHRAVFDSDIMLTMKAYILTAMPAYKEEELDELTMSEFTNKVVMAENIITIQQMMSGIPSEGFKLTIVPINETEEVAEEQPPVQQTQKTQRQPPKKAPAKPVSDSEHERQKRALIEKIKLQNLDAYNVHDSNSVLPDPKQYEEMDVDTLRGILGLPRQDDPIAAKLRRAMGG